MNNVDIDLVKMIMNELGVGPEEAINMSFNPEYQNMMAGPMAGQFAGQQGIEASRYPSMIADKHPVANAIINKHPVANAVMNKHPVASGLFQQDGGCLAKGGVVIDGRCVMPGQNQPTQTTMPQFPGIKF